MAADAVEVTVIAGEPMLGVWCNRCRNPAAVTFAVYALSTITDDPGVLDLGTVTRCLDCDDWIVPAREDDQSRAPNSNPGRCL